MNKVIDYLNYYKKGKIEVPFEFESDHGILALNDIFADYNCIIQTQHKIISIDFFKTKNEKIRGN